MSSDKVRPRINKNKSALKPGQTGFEVLGEANGIQITRYRLRGINGHLVDFYDDGVSRSGTPGASRQVLIRASQKRVRVYPDTNDERDVPAFYVDKRGDCPELDGRLWAVGSDYSDAIAWFQGEQAKKREKVRADVARQQADAAEAVTIEKAKRGQAKKGKAAISVPAQET